MAGSNENTRGSNVSRSKAQSSQPLSKAESSALESEIKDSQVVGQPPGMSLETKLGMCIIVILVGAFGFLVYRKFDMRQQQLLQVAGSGDVVTDGGVVAPEDALGEEDIDPTRLASFEKRSALDISDGIDANDRSSELLAGMAPDMGVHADSTLDTAIAQQSEPELTATFDDDPFEEGQAEQSIDLESITLIPDESAMDTGIAGGGEDSDPFTPQPAVAGTDETESLFDEFVDSRPSAEVGRSGDIGQSDVQQELAAFDAVSEPDDSIQADSIDELFPEAIDSQTAGIPLAPVAEVQPESVAATQGTTPVLAIPAEDQNVETAESPFADFEGLVAVDDDGPQLKRAEDDNSNLLAMLEPPPNAETQHNQFAESDEPTVTFPDADSFESVTIQPAPAGTVVAQSVSQSDESAVPDLSQQFLVDSDDGAQTQGDGGVFDFPDDSTEQQSKSSVQVNRAIGTNPGNSTTFDLNGFQYENGVRQVAHTDDQCKVLVVQPNENYWKISKRGYGTARYFSALALYNQHRISDPRKMRPGMKVLIPKAEVLEQKYPELFKDLQAKPKLPAGYFVTKEGSPAYRVGDTETLSEIAERHLGRSSRWVQIYRMNQHVLKDPNKLKLGLVLQLPDDATDIHVAP